MTKIHDLIVENSQLLAGYNYAYISSTGLFLSLKNYTKIPNDFDIAIDWNNKNKKDLLSFYKKLKQSPYVKKLMFKSIEEQSLKNIFVKKGQHICLNCKILEDLLMQGNLKITYLYKDMLVEIFPEREGNGVTNIDVLGPKLRNVEIGNKSVVVLDTLEIAKRYVINFVDEVMHKNIKNILNKGYKHKDAIRLNNILNILYDSNLDYSPKGILTFIDNTIKELEQNLPKDKISLFMQYIFKSYPLIQKKILHIYRLYLKIDNGSFGDKVVSFCDFHQNLKEEVLQMHKLVIYYKKHLYNNLTAKRSSFMAKAKFLECEKIKEYVSTVNLKNDINGFVYFYEFYSTMNMVKGMS